MTVRLEDVGLPVLLITRLARLQLELHLVFAGPDERAVSHPADQLGNLHHHRSQQLLLDQLAELNHCRAFAPADHRVGLQEDIRQLHQVVAVPGFVFGAVIFGEPLNGQAAWTDDDLGQLSPLHLLCHDGGMLPPVGRVVPDAGEGRPHPLADLCVQLVSLHDDRHVVPAAQVLVQSAELDLPQLVVRDEHELYVRAGQ